MSSLFYLNKYLVKYKWRLIFGSIFILISNIFAVQQPEIVRDAINKINQQLINRDPSLIEGIVWIALSFAGFYMLLSVLKGLFLFFTRQTIIIMSRFIEYDLKNEIYNHYQRLTFNFYKKNSTGDLMNRISEDVSKVRMYLGPGIMYTFNLITLFGLVLYKMISKNPELTLYVLIPLPIMSILIYFVSRVLNRKNERVQFQQSFLSTFVQESFSGIRIIKSHVKEKDVESRFAQEAEKYKANSMSLAKTNAFFMPTILLLIGISTILTIYIGGTQAKNGVIDPGEIAEFVIYVNMLTWPFASVGWVTSIVQGASASQTRINEFLNEVPDINLNEGVDATLKFDSKITFKDVSLTYDNSGVTALQNVNFTLHKGEIIGVIGRTGSGKSSLAYLFIRMLDPTSGTIMIDDQNLAEVNLDSWRNLLGYVPQEHFLFSDSIKNNIIFGAKSDQITEEQLIQVAINSGIHDSIMNFPDQYQTLLGERGINLSGGQKQRLSIARALIKKPDILIFDDCLSAVDNETEEFILQAIRNDLKEKTAIIISHRISSLKYADKIMVLDEGQVVEVGDHTTLMALDGLYAETYHRQEVTQDNTPDQ